MDRSLFERFLFASRWLLLPFYVALIAAQLALMGKVARRTYELAISFWTLGEEAVLLSALQIVDFTLSASLILIVALSGYENFVSRIERRAGDRRPMWIADIDFSALKLKLIASIVAIAAVKLLEAFMNIDHTSDRDLAWLVGLFAAFVIAGLLLAVAERVGESGRRHASPDAAARPTD
jgi:uncharacterized protein (TIGR00645 family)